MGSCKILLFYSILLSSTQFFSVDSHEFKVGDDNGWAAPSSKNEDFYNNWASKERFSIDDTIYFEYKEDSVLVVTDNEYEKCHSSRPIFFSNSGNTTYKLHRSGLFYFISGVSGHCDKGQKLIIKVLEQPKSSPPAGKNGTSGSSGSSGAINVAAPIAAPLLMSAIVTLFRFF